MAPGSREGEGRAVPGRESGKEAPGARRTFIVSLVQDESGRLSGVVELVRTGRKERVEGVEAIGAVIQAMLAPGAAEDAGAS